jgi:hypothetical protein
MTTKTVQEHSIADVLKRLDQIEDLLLFALAPEQAKVGPAYVGSDGKPIRKGDTVELVKQHNSKKYGRIFNVGERFQVSWVGESDYGGINVGLILQNGLKLYVAIDKTKGVR